MFESSFSMCLTKWGEQTCERVDPAYYKVRMALHVFWVRSSCCSQAELVYASSQRSAWKR